MAEDQAQPSLFAVARAAGRQVTSLIHLDAQLLEVEMKEKASDVVLSGVWGLAAFVVFAFGALMCVQGLVLVLIAFGFAPFIAAFTVGASLCAVGGLFLLKAGSVLKGWSILPTRTLVQVRKDAEALREGLRNGTR